MLLLLQADARTIILNRHDDLVLICLLVECLASTVHERLVVVIKEYVAGGGSATLEELVRLKKEILPHRQYVARDGISVGRDKHDCDENLLALRRELQSIGSVIQKNLLETSLVDLDHTTLFMVDRKVKHLEMNNDIFLGGLLLEQLNYETYAIA